MSELNDKVETPPEMTDEDEQLLDEIWDRIGEAENDNKT